MYKNKQLMKKKGSSITRRHVSNNKKGGYWGTVINQAVVPMSILGATYSYKKKGRQYNNHDVKTRRRGRRTRRRRSFR